MLLDSANHRLPTPTSRPNTLAPRHTRTLFPPHRGPPRGWRLVPSPGPAPRIPPSSAARDPGGADPGEGGAGGRCPAVPVPVPAPALVTPFAFALDPSFSPRSFPLRSGAGCECARARGAGEEGGSEEEETSGGGGKEGKGGKGEQR